MSRAIAVVLACAALAAGCSKEKETEKPAVTTPASASAAPSAAPAASAAPTASAMPSASAAASAQPAIPSQADESMAAAKEIDKSNYKSELDKIEKEIAK